jgi:hypothetical protein
MAFSKSPFLGPSNVPQSLGSQPYNLSTVDTSINRNLVTLSNRRLPRVVSRISQISPFTARRRSHQPVGKPPTPWTPSQSRQLVRLFFDSDVQWKHIPGLLEEGDFHPKYGSPGMSACRMDLESS